MVPPARVSRLAPRVAGTPVRREAVGSVHPAHLAAVGSVHPARRAAAVTAQPVLAVHREAAATAHPAGEQRPARAVRPGAAVIEPPARVSR